MVPLDGGTIPAKSGCVIQQPNLRRTLKPLQIRHGLRRASGSGEDGPGVVLQYLEPVRKVLRMVGAHLLGDVKLAAQEGRADLGHKLFSSIRMVAEALAHVAIEP